MRGIGPWKIYDEWLKGKRAKKYKKHLIEVNHDPLPQQSSTSAFTSKIPGKTTRKIIKAKNGIKLHWVRHWKWYIMLIVALVGLYFTWDNRDKPKTEYTKIKWEFVFNKKAHPGLKGQFSGFKEMKEGTHKIELPWGQSGTCEVYDNGTELTLQSTLRVNPKYPDEVGLRVTEECSEARFRDKALYCCWVE